MRHRGSGFRAGATWDLMRCAQVHLLNVGSLPLSSGLSDLSAPLINSLCRYAASHPGWQVYWKDQNGDIAEMLGLTTQDPYVNGGGDDGSQQGGSLHLQLPPAPELVMPRPPAPSPFAAVAQPNGPPRLLPGSGPKIATSASPFAAGPLMGHISDAFPNWQQGMAQHQLATETRGLDHGTSAQACLPALPA